MKKLLVLTILIIGVSGLFARVYDISEFGAIGDGETLNTKSIQSAIDKCTKAGGGTVLIQDGIYITGTIFLKSNVTLHVANGAILRGSPTIDDYSTGTHKIMYRGENIMDRCLIFARDAHSISIEGYGTIDGNGHRENFSNNGRPMLLRLLNCEDIHLNNITLINPAAWTSAFLYCNRISVVGIRIHSRVNGNGDGLDFDGCTEVRVSNCTFDNSDDSICLQASKKEFPCRDVVVSNCIFSTKWAGMRIGLLSVGDFESVTVSNCTFRDIQDSGLKIQMNEGGEMKNMVFSDLVMENVPRPVLMTLCRQRACVDSPEDFVPSSGSLHSMLFQNFIIDNTRGDQHSCFIFSGMPGNNIRDIAVRNIVMKVAGGGTAQDASRVDVPEFTLEVLKGHWPEYYLLGTIPACGFFVRHLEGFTLKDVTIQNAADDERPAIILNDVADGQISGIMTNNPFGSAVAMKLVNTRDISLTDCRQKGSAHLLEVKGEDTKNVTMDGDDL